MVVGADGELHRNKDDLSSSISGVHERDAIKTECDKYINLIWDVCGTERKPQMLVKPY